MPPDLLIPNIDYSSLERRIATTVGLSNGIYGSGRNQGLEYIVLTFDLRPEPPTIWQILMRDD